MPDDNNLAVGSPVGGAIVTTDPADVHATQDTNLGKGGLMSVADNAARNAITEDRLRTGMVVYTRDSETYWKLKTGYVFPQVDNNWEVWMSSGAVPGIQTEFFVNGGTGDDTNDGTAASPFATVQKAINESAVASAFANSVTINIADGSYEEFLLIPSGAHGKINLIGNVANPAVVALKSPVAQFGTLLGVDNPDLTVEVNGISFIRGQYGIRILQGRVIVKFCLFVTCGLSGAVEGVNSLLHFKNNSDGDSQIVGPNLSGSHGLHASNQGSLDIDQDLSISAAQYSISNSSGYLYVRSTRNLTLSTRPEANAAAIRMRDNSYNVIHATITPDGAAPTGLLTTGFNSAIDIENSVLAMTFSSNINISNYFAGFKMGSGARVKDENTWSYTNVTLDVIYDNSTSWSSLSDFDTSQIVFIGNPDFSHGLNEQLFYERLIGG